MGINRRTFFSIILAFLSGVLTAYPPQEYLFTYNNCPNAMSAESEEFDCCRPAFWFDLSFLYYRATEDGLDLANSAAVVTSGDTSGTVVGINNSKTLVQDFEYKPGVKLGFGTSCCEWIFNLDYMWLNQTTTTNASPLAVDSAIGSGVWMINNWFEQLSTVDQLISANNISSNWSLCINLVDVAVRNAFYAYERCHLLLVPFFGLRGAWIRQKLDFGITVSPIVVTDLATASVSSHNSSNSWALGPRTGFDAFWFLPCGFRVEGKVATSLLFTQYTNVQHWENVASASSAPSILSGNLSDFSCLRPDLEFDLGIAWGTFTRWGQYVDVSISYDFVLFWQQNMMRKLADQLVWGSGAAPGNLSLHGLEIKATFYY